MTASSVKYGNIRFSHKSIDRYHAISSRDIFNESWTIVISLIKEERPSVEFFINTSKGHFIHI